MVSVVKHLLKKALVTELGGPFLFFKGETLFLLSTYYSNQALNYYSLRSLSATLHIVCQSLDSNHCSFDIL